MLTDGDDDSWISVSPGCIYQSKLESYVEDMSLITEPIRIRYIDLSIPYCDPHHCITTLANFIDKHIEKFGVAPIVENGCELVVDDNTAWFYDNFDDFRTQRKLFEYVEKLIVKPVHKEARTVSVPDHIDRYDTYANVHASIPVFQSSKLKSIAFDSGKSYTTFLTIMFTYFIDVNNDDLMNLDYKIKHITFPSNVSIIRTNNREFRCVDVENEIIYEYPDRPQFAFNKATGCKVLNVPECCEKLIWNSYYQMFEHYYLPTNPVLISIGKYTDDAEKQDTITIWRSPKNQVGETINYSQLANNVIIKDQ